MAEKTYREIRGATRDLFERGKAAVQKNNWDYALTIFNQVLSDEPSFFEGREELRKAQFLKADQKKGFLKKFLKTAGASPALAKARVLINSNPDEAIHLAEQVLNTNPENSLAHKTVAESALNAGYHKTAILSFEIARKNSPSDYNLALRTAEALAEIDQVGRAEQVIQEFCKANPDHSDAKTALKDFSAKRTMKRGGYDKLADGKGSYRDILKDESEAISLEQENREVNTSETASRLIAENLVRMEAEPGNLKTIRKITDLYLQQDDFENALKYCRIHQEKLDGNDPEIDKFEEEIQVKRMDQKIAGLNPDLPDEAETRNRLLAEKQAFMLESCQKRSNRFPNDLFIRYELGVLNFDSGNIGEAIKDFQKSQVNPNRKIPALNYLAKCFAHRAMHDLAAKTFRNALKEKVVFDDEAKDLTYHLALCLEKMNQTDQAIEEFKKIYEVDIEYRDVSDKVDAFYS
ncbi:MAG TPA: tetratricopeptide repeat protein [Verrucomicrobiales bacterium]|nr:tetratricopeptide repeat protein [Verrucomicrobiales bacterium]HIL70608.1 tetratricopeptide repeat protein [Verrucomicrobiota bacterium]